jgi:hypothetical protein
MCACVCARPAVGPAAGRAGRAADTMMADGLLLLVAHLLATAIGAIATPLPSNLRVERLLERDALGVDGTAQLLFNWAYEHVAAGPCQAERGQAPPAVRVDLRNGAQQMIWSHNVDKGGVTSVRYSGPVLPGAARYSWTVCTAEERAPSQCASASFLTAPADWSGAEWIAGRQLRSPKLLLGGKKVLQATVQVTGLGFYELRLNGEKVGDAELDPGFSTNYTARVLFAVHDVTAAVQNASASGGELVLAARVGAGKYSMAVSHSNAITNSSVFALLCHLTVALSDGTNLSLVTSDKWLVSAAPFVSEHLYHGEVYDARLALAGWDGMAYEPPAANWSAARVIEPPLGKGVVLSPRLFPPIRVIKVVTPVSVTQLRNVSDGRAEQRPTPPCPDNWLRQGTVCVQMRATSSWMYDLGNNYAGTVFECTTPAALQQPNWSQIAAQLVCMLVHSPPN